jgi:hypothetical protein
MAIDCAELGAWLEANCPSEDRPRDWALFGDAAFHADRVATIFGY